MLKIAIFVIKIIRMARILALDYGEKRTGIAVTDELQIIASGLITVKTDKLIKFLIDYTNKEHVKVICDLHKELLPESLLPKMGKFFMSKFYYAVMTKEGWLDGYLYKHNGKYIAFPGLKVNREKACGFFAARLAS